MSIRRRVSSLRTPAWHRAARKAPPGALPTPVPSSGASQWWWLPSPVRWPRCRCSLGLPRAWTPLLRDVSAPSPRPRWCQRSRPPARPQECPSFVEGQGDEVGGVPVRPLQGGSVGGGRPWFAASPSFLRAFQCSTTSGGSRVSAGVAPAFAVTQRDHRPKMAWSRVRGCWLTKTAHVMAPTNATAEEA